MVGFYQTPTAPVKIRRAFGGLASGLALAAWPTQVSPGCWTTLPTAEFLRRRSPLGLANAPVGAALRALQLDPGPRGGTNRQRRGKPQLQSHPHPASVTGEPSPDQFSTAS
jgi:hypothetical protein